jgi:hypothetical protein
MEEVNHPDNTAAAMSSNKLNKKGDINHPDSHG